MSEDVSMQLDSPAAETPRDTPRNDALDLDVRTRLSNLCNLDVQITQILERGSAIAKAITEGKLRNNDPSKRENFKAAVENYNQLVEEVNGKLRKEVKFLHDASHTQLLPLYIPVQAAAFGREKEDMIHESLAKRV